MKKKLWMLQELGLATFLLYFGYIFQATIMTSQEYYGYIAFYNLIAVSEILETLVCMFLLFIYRPRK